MKICIVGAGAIGGLLAVPLHHAGNDVTVIARGPHLETIRDQGLTVQRQDGTRLHAAVCATGDFASAGKQELVLLAVKAHQLGAVATQVSLLFDPGTCVVTLQNGIPFWSFHRHGGEHEGLALQSVDPGGAIARAIDPARVVHSVVYPAAEVIAPGLIRHEGGDRFPVGEPDNQDTERVQVVSRLLTAAGFQAPVLTDTRGEVWLKLLGNVCFNPISALSQATVIEFLEYPLTRALVQRMMEEAQAVAAALGVRVRLPIERRIAGAEKLGNHKMSMLQDIEAERPLEIDALVGAVIEIGRLTGVRTPSIEALYATTKLLERHVQAGRPPAA
ncbi:MAG: 2-dehydropantoate 2-reductase [Burkholderiaceae bacterium]